MEEKEATERHLIPTPAVYHPFQDLSGLISVVGNRSKSEGNGWGLLQSVMFMFALFKQTSFCRDELENGLHSPFRYLGEEQF